MAVTGPVALFTLTIPEDYRSGDMGKGQRIENLNEESSHQHEGHFSFNCKYHVLISVLAVGLTYALKLTESTVSSLSSSTPKNFAKMAKFL